ncbi:hypothetical protein K788_0000558 [Paraburkholderia caribensis MBA4]|uniref:Uncharacterized protein n=2 Tax=Paraburkholderia caribensis TaxID=75105 RepID=A0A0P0RI21_9BURK|nr:hypothetical protein K788_0000558 [Paraburkholderia caribensis MBA4]
MVCLMQVMVAQDFNLGQIGFVVVTRGMLVALKRSKELLEAMESESCSGR